MSIKACKQCGEIKPLDDFYAAPGNLDGKSGKCKECIKANARANRAANIDYYREYDRKRGGGRWSQEYLDSDAFKESARRAKEKWAANNPIKVKAATKVGNTVRDGKLDKSVSCEVCGTTDAVIHGHHDDYSKPLEVRWLCAACHRQWHVENGEALNAGEVA